jgi:hypothetical protein
VATARQQAHDETWRWLAPLGTADQHPWLDSLLQPDAQTGCTLLHWLRREATAHTAVQMVETLQKVTCLLEARVDHRQGLRVDTFVEARVSSRHAAVKRGLHTVLEPTFKGLG